MEGNVGKKRMKSLSRDTRHALLFSLNGLVALTRLLLSDRSIRFVLLRHFQTDRLEGAFGDIRQLCGGSRLVTVDQVLCSVKLRRVELFNKLKIEFYLNLQKIVLLLDSFPFDCNHIIVCPFE